MDQVMQAELVNDIFNRIEQVFSAHLASGGVSPGAQENPATQEEERNASLRHRKVLVSSKSNNGVVFPPVHVHGLVLDRAHRLGLVHPAVGRLRRQLQHGQGRVHVNVNLDMAVPTVPTRLRVNQKYTFPMPKAINCSVYVVLAQMIQLIYEYHFGKRMGKHIQFYLRFQKSLTVLAEYLRDRLQATTEAHNTLLADTLLRASVQVFGGRFSFETRKSWRDDCRTIIEEKYRCRSTDNEERTITNMTAESTLQGIVPFNENVNIMQELIAHGGSLLVFLIDLWSLSKSILHHYVDEGALRSISAAVPIFGPTLKELMTSQRKPVFVEDVVTPGQLSCIEETFQSALQCSDPPLVMVHVPFSLSRRKFASHMRVLNFSHSRDSMKAAVFDFVVDFSEPEFHKVKCGHDKELQRLVTCTGTAVEQIISRFCDMAVNDNIMHDVVLLRRQFRELGRHKAVINAYASEVAPRYDPLYQTAEFACDVQNVLQRLPRLNELYHVPVNLFLHFLRQSFKAKSEEPVTAFMLDFVARVGRWLAQGLTELDQIGALCALKVLYMCGIGEIKQHDETLKSLLIALEQRISSSNSGALVCERVRSLMRKSSVFPVSSTLNILHCIRLSV